MKQELILTKENVGFYLFLRGMLDLSECSIDYYKVRVSISRNLSFKLSHKNGKKFFIKQLCHFREVDKEAFAFEMAFYSACSENPTFTPLSTLIPKLFFYDPVYQIAVSELLENYDSPDLHKDSLKNIVKALSRIREIPIRNANNDQKPELMNLPFLNYSNTIIEHLRKTSGLGNAIMQMNENWTPFNLLHNDIKPGNILVNHHNDVKIIDWEKMSTGDLLWDLAALIVYSFKEDKTIYQASRASEEYLIHNSANMQSITSTYQPEWSYQEKIRLTRYVGLQILTQLMESKKENPQPLILQLATDLLLNPDRFLLTLFNNHAE